MEISSEKWSLLLMPPARRHRHPAVGAGDIPLPPSALQFLIVSHFIEFKKWNPQSLLKWVSWQCRPWWGSSLQFVCSSDTKSKGNLVGVLKASPCPRGLREGGKYSVSWKEIYWEEATEWPTVASEPQEAGGKTGCQSSKEIGLRTPVGPFVTSKHFTLHDLLSHLQAASFCIHANLPLGTWIL